jgi:hypothetical protein
MRFQFKTVARLALMMALGSGIGTPAHAWDGIIRAVIVGVEPTGSGLVVYFQGFPLACAGGGRRAYLPANTPNYQTFVSVTLTAMAAKTPVYVYSSTVGGDCQIGVMTAGDTPNPP